MTKFNIKHDGLWNYRAVCTRVIDGDTVELKLDCGFRTYRVDRFRLAGIDTPETYRRKSGMTDEEWATEKERGQKATDRVKSLILGKEVLVKTEKSDKYGRWLGVISVEISNHWHIVNQMLVEEGYANRLLIRPRGLVSGDSPYRGPCSFVSGLPKGDLLV